MRRNASELERKHLAKQMAQLEAAAAAFYYYLLLGPRGPLLARHNAVPAPAVVPVALTRAILPAQGASRREEDSRTR